MWSLPFDYQETEKKLNDRIEKEGGWTVVMLMVVMMMKVKGLSLILIVINSFP